MRGDGRRGEAEDAVALVGGWRGHGGLEAAVAGLVHGAQRPEADAESQPGATVVPTQGRQAADRLAAALPQLHDTKGRSAKETSLHAPPSADSGPTHHQSIMGHKWGPSAYLADARALVAELGSSHVVSEVVVELIGQALVHQPEYFHFGVGGTMDHQ